MINGLERRHVLNIGVIHLNDLEGKCLVLRNVSTVYGVYKCDGLKRRKALSIGVKLLNGFE